MKGGIIRVQASAGSGKTYHLSRRYVELLAGVCADRPGLGSGDVTGCSSVNSMTGDPASLLAITFTNKAAAEMKERILLFLKRIAFRDMPESMLRKDFPFLKPEQAFGLLTAIIREYGRFNVKTIDAFMNTILKSFAVDLGLLPDFRLSLKTDDIHDMAMEELFEHGSAMSESLEDLVLRECQLLDARGFDAEAIVRRAVNRLRDQDVHTGEVLAEKASELDAERKGLLKEAETWLKSAVEASEGRLHKNIFQLERNLTMLKRGDWPSWMKKTYDLREKTSGESEFPGVDQFQLELNALRERRSRLILDQAILAMQSGVAVFSEVRKRETELALRLNRFEIKEMAEAIQGMLSELGASAAFCRLGEQYTHYLIDEFQDTSRAQWNALAPLVENSLSAGGSLYLVGDTKQAIYGWRGGDYRLFADVIRRDVPPDLIPVVDPIPDSALDERTLTCNYRSRHEIVSFNNEAFRQLAAGNVKLREGSETLKQIYGSCRQDEREGPGGFVQINRIPGEDRDRFIREWVFTVLTGLLKRRRAGDILFLARRKKEVRQLASWMAEWEIPFVTEDSLKLYGNTTVKSLLNLFAYMVLPDGDFYLSGVIENGWFGKLEPDVAGRLLVDRYAYTQEDPGEDTWASWMKREHPSLYESLLEPVLRTRFAGSAYEQISELVRHLDLLGGPDAVFVQRFMEQVMALEEEGTVEPAQIARTQFEHISETVLSMPVHHGAVRIMTIHKAKGLESPVVILPFTEWELTHRNADIIGQTEDGHTVRITNELSECDPLLEKAYTDFRTRETVESINMLYVALTRASEELAVLIPSSPTKESRTAGEVLSEMLDQSGLMMPDAETASWGRPVNGEQDTADNAVSERIELVRASDRLVVQDRTEDTFQDLAGRLRGTLMHEALRGIVRLPDDHSDLESLASSSLDRAAARLGFHPDVMDRGSLVTLLTDTLHLLSSWFSGDLEAWNEKELVLGNGRIIRLDRLVRRGETWTILDYKTGHRDPGHRKQLKRYAGAFSRMGITPELVLVYLDQGEVEYVR